MDDDGARARRRRGRVPAAAPEGRAHARRADRRRANRLADRPAQPAPAGRRLGIACGTEKGSYVATAAGALRRRPARLQRRAHRRRVRVRRDRQSRRAAQPGRRRGRAGPRRRAVRGDRVRRRPDPERDDGQYRVPRFKDVPPIEIILLDRQDLPSAGAGETPIVCVAPAIGSAARAFGQVAHGAAGRLRRTHAYRRRVAVALLRQQFLPLLDDRPRDPPGFSVQSTYLARSRRAITLKPSSCRYFMYSSNRSGGVFTHGCSRSGTPWNCSTAIRPLPRLGDGALEIVERPAGPGVAGRGDQERMVAARFVGEAVALVVRDTRARRRGGRSGSRARAGSGARPARWRCQGRRSDVGPRDAVLGARALIASTCSAVAAESPCVGAMWSRVWLPISKPSRWSSAICSHVM